MNEKTMPCPKRLSLPRSADKMPATETKALVTLRQKSGEARFTHSRNFVITRTSSASFAPNQNSRVLPHSRLSTAGCRVRRRL
jgi:hypothetical protein